VGEPDIPAAQFPPEWYRAESEARSGSVGNHRVYSESAHFVERRARIAQMMRVNLFRPVHVKTLMSQKRRALLNARKLLQAYSATIDIPARFRNSKAVGPGRTNNLTRTTRWSWLKAWAMNIAKRRGMARSSAGRGRPHWPPSDLTPERFMGLSGILCAGP
jgi:hypothetical protein